MWGEWISVDPYVPSVGRRSSEMIHRMFRSGEGGGCIGGSGSGGSDGSDGGGGGGDGGDGVDGGDDGGGVQVLMLISAPAALAIPNVSHFAVRRHQPEDQAE